LLEHYYNYYKSLKFFSLITKIRLLRHTLYLFVGIIIEQQIHRCTNLRL